MVNRLKKMTVLEFWILIWGLGLAGQFCWNIENQWFATFVYAKIAGDSNIITWMTILSATATTFSTFFFGTISDRAGQRRKLVAIGYIFWGIFTIVYGLTEYIPRTTSNYLFAAIMVVFFDSVMSFIGSMGNDSGFNAWTNDNMTDSNRGQIGATLATQPVIATILGTVIGGIIVGSNNNYQLLFWTFGGFVIAVGVLAFIFMKDNENLKPSKNGSFWHQFSTVFNFKEFFKMKELLWVNLILCVYFIGYNCYFSYIGAYMIYYLGFSATFMGYIEASALLFAMLLSIPAGILINRNKSPLICLVAVAADIVGLLILFFLVDKTTVDTSTIFNWWLLLGVFLVGAGYVLMVQTTVVWTKQLYPSESRGQFEGIRILFFVLLPMVFGPLIINPVIKATGSPYQTTYAMGTVTGLAPTGIIYLVGAIVSSLSVIPILFAAKEMRKRLEMKKIESAQN